MYKAKPDERLPLVCVGPLHVTGFKQFLPAGEFERHNYAEGVTYTSERKKSLVQVYTDPGGLRTVAVAEIWGRDPGKNTRQW